MQIGILGAGKIGGGLARRLVPAGHEVMLAGRDSTHDLAERARRLGARAGGVGEAARFGEVVVLAVPWAEVRAALHAAGTLAGRILWDCTNPLAPDLSGLVVSGARSGGEEVAAAVPAARVVKAIPPFSELLNGAPLPAGAAKPAVFLCADDAAAKQVVAPLVAALGAEAIDAGALRNARYAEPAGMLLVQLAYPQGLGGRIGATLVRYRDAA